MIPRRAKAAGIETKIGNHTFRATGITAYLKNSGKLEVAQQPKNAGAMSYTPQPKSGGLERFLSFSE